MKIMICGKGGCGKSTVSSLLAKKYAALGKRVLVVDADESNYGLHRQLGAELPKDFTLYFGSKKGIFQKVDKGNPDLSPFEKRWTLDDLPEEFVTRSQGTCAPCSSPDDAAEKGAAEREMSCSTSENACKKPEEVFRKDNAVMLMAVGKIHEAGEGCACPMGTLARHLISNLDLNDNDIVIIDAEAGVEHFGRGVDSATDVILMIVDPSYESLMLSRKIREMGKSIGKPVRFVLNKVNEEKYAVMKSVVSDPENIIASIPENQAVLIKGLKGEPLDCDVPEIGELIAALDSLSRAAM